MTFLLTLLRKFVMLVRKYCCTTIPAATTVMDYHPLQLKDTNDTLGKSPNSVVLGILTPPLHTNNLPHPPLVDKKSSHSCHGSILPSNQNVSNNVNNKQLMDTKDLMMILESGVQKYSIEWFTIKSVMNNYHK